MTVSVYLAAPYPARAQAAAVREQLVDAGIDVTSRWLDSHQDDNEDAALEDLNDLERADVFVALNFAGWANAGTGGRHVEMGYALALGKAVVLVGPRTNVFHQLSEITVLDSADLLVSHLLRGK